MTTEKSMKIAEQLKQYVNKDGSPKNVSTDYVDMRIVGGKAISTPARGRGRPPKMVRVQTEDGIFESKAACAAHYGITETTVYNRVRYGKEPGSPYSNWRFLDV